MLIMGQSALVQSITVVDLEKLEGGFYRLRESKTAGGLGGTAPPDTEGYFQFNMNFVSGFCMFK